MLMREQIFAAAERCGLKRIRSCCNVEGKLCANDEWRGNLAAFAAAIRSQWISVKERLPESEVSVLIAMKNGRIEKTCWYAGEFLRPSSEQPTHWMPLPPPPASDTVSEDRERE
jgi:hypothetical protein